MKTVQNLLLLAIFGFSTIAALDEIALTPAEQAEALQYIVMPTPNPFPYSFAEDMKQFNEIELRILAAEVAHDLGYDEDGCPRQDEECNPSCLNLD